MRSVVLVLALLPLISLACDGDDARETIATRTPALVATDGRPTLFRLDTFELVNEVFVEGRIPGGLLGEVHITTASARFAAGEAERGEGSGQYFALSIVGEAREHFALAHPSYAWWFTTTAHVDDYPLQVEADTPELRVALRPVDGALRLFADDGSGWEPAEGSFGVGELEVWARVRMDERWNFADRYAYVRAIVRHLRPAPEGYEVGEVYPRNLMWNFIGGQ
jgi:hypothetical protein